MTFLTVSTAYSDKLQQRFVNEFLLAAQLQEVATMPLFGRRKPVGGDDPWRGWPDTLDVQNRTDVDWIIQSDDPLVWHDAALACLIFLGDPHGLLARLVQQRTLDRVTAAAMFLHGGNGVHRLKGDHINIGCMDKTQIEELIDQLCVLDRTLILADNGIGMEPGWESARLDTLAELAGDPRAPLRMLERPIDLRTATMPYVDIGEGDLISRKHMRETMPYLFD